MHHQSRTFRKRYWSFDLFFASSTGWFSNRRPTSTSRRHCWRIWSWRDTCGHWHRSSAGWPLPSVEWSVTLVSPSSWHHMGSSLEYRHVTLYSVGRQYVNFVPRSSIALSFYLKSIIFDKFYKHLSKNTFRDLCFHFRFQVGLIKRDIVGFNTNSMLVNCCCD